MPLPRFWYLPRGEKAAVAMSGDDHSPGLVARRHREPLRALQDAEPGRLRRGRLGVRALDLVRLHERDDHQRAGGELRRPGLRGRPAPRVRRLPAPPFDLEDIAASFDNQLAAGGRSTRASRRLSPAARTASRGRTGCPRRSWSSSAGCGSTRTTTTTPRAGSGRKPGFMNGGGFPMRFADLDGTQIDVYQQNTNMTDESGQAVPGDGHRAARQRGRRRTATTACSGPTCTPTTRRPTRGAEAIVAAAQARSVPVISYKQLLDWVDGRNSSTIRAWTGTPASSRSPRRSGPARAGCRRCSRRTGPAGTLSALTCGGSPKAYTVQTIKGVDYAMFDAVTGTCRATYS